MQHAEKSLQNAVLQNYKLSIVRDTTARFERTADQFLDVHAIDPFKQFARGHYYELEF